MWLSGYGCNACSLIIGLRSTSNTQGSGRVLGYIKQPYRPILKLGPMEVCIIWARLHLGSVHLARCFGITNKAHSKTCFVKGEVLQRARGERSHREEGQTLKSTSQSSYPSHLVQASSRSSLTQPISTHKASNNNVDPVQQHVHITFYSSAATALLYSRLRSECWSCHRHIFVRNLQNYTWPSSTATH